MENPLNVALGNTLKKLRSNFNIPIDTLVSSIGINESYYRLVESGGNAPHVSRVMDLISSFNHFGANLSFDGVLKVLMGIHFTQPLQKLLEENSKLFYSEKERTFEKVKVYDFKLYLLLTKFDEEGLFDNREITGKDIVRLLENTKLLEEFQRFLDSYENYGKTNLEIQLNQLNNMINELPTIYGRNTFYNFKSKINAPEIMDGKKYSLWELTNQKNFTELLVLTENPDAITSTYNFRDNRYDFLWSNDFKVAKMIVIEDNKKQGINYQIQEFEKNFRTVIKNDKLRLATFENALEKVDYSVIRSDYKSELVTDILSGTPDKTKIINKETSTFNAFWVYTIKEDNYVFTVGFLGDLEYDKNIDKYSLKNVISLGFEYLSEKLSKITTL